MQGPLNLIFYESLTVVLLVHTKSFALGHTPTDAFPTTLLRPANNGLKHVEFAHEQLKFGEMENSALQSLLMLMLNAHMQFKVSWLVEEKNSFR